MEPNAYILKMSNITKKFPGVTALDKVTFDCEKGEVHALVGENGAGKSTLMKILSGAYHPDEGEIYFDGKKVEIGTPRRSQELGIGIVMQEFNLLPYLTVEENIFLGREKVSKFGLIDSQQMTNESRKLFELLNVDINTKELVDNLNIAQRQFVEIAKALSLGAKLLIMDEPSATLTDRELDYLFQVIDNLKKSGTSIIYISHRLVEIFKIADRVTVLKDGKVIGTKMIQEVDRDKLVEMMVGRPISDTFPPRDRKIGDVALKVEGITNKNLPHPITLDIHSGEIIGLAGLVGSGRTELARAIFGSDRIDSGRIILDTETIKLQDPSDAVKKGIVLIPEDRKLEGLVLIQSIRRNIGLPNMDLFSKLGFVRSRRELIEVNSAMKKLDIRAQNSNQLTQTLSGGNQQKVVIAKWLVRTPRIIILDEPTRGIDVATKAEIYQIMHNLASTGIGILMISSELPEILGMADRILVMNERKLTAEFIGSKTSEEEIMHAATGEYSVA